jgi:hypothetical protein
MKRAIKIEGIDKELQLSKYTTVKLGKGKNFIHLDELEDGTWRIVHTDGVIEDLTKVECLRIVRED